MRQLLSNWPPSMVSAKCTSQLSSGSTLPMPAAIPPSAMTVCALPSKDLVTTVTLQPASAAAIAARIPAPPAPTTRTSHSMVSYGSGVAAISENDVRVDDDPGAKEVDVHVRDDDAEHAAPRPHRMTLVEHGHPTPRAITSLANRGFRVAVKAAADEVAPRMTTERVP